MRLPTKDDPGMAKPAEQGAYRNHGEEARGRRWHRLAILLLACATLPAFAAPPVRVSPSYNRLKLDFDQGIQTWGNDERDDVVTLRPELPLRCHWDDDTTLLCMLPEGRRFTDATRYDVRIAAGLKTQAGTTLPAQALSFETTRPGLSASVDGWSAGMPDISIDSNMETDGDDARRVLRVSVDEKPVAFSLAPSPAENWRPAGRSFELHVPDMGAGVHRLVVSAVPGLRSDAGPLRGVQDGALLAVLANEPFALRGVSCTGPEGEVSAEPRAGLVAITCPAGQPLWLELSRKPDEASLSRLQQSLPPGVQLRRNEYRPYRRERERRFVASPSAFVALEMQDSGASAVLGLDAQFRSGDGAGLQPVRVELHAGDFQPQLRGRYADALVADGSKPPVLVESLDAPGRRLQARSLGAVARDGEVATPANAEGGPQSLQSTDTARALAEGGWASWTPATQNDRYSGANRIQFAAPDFDLHAVSGRREVLVWANAWKDHAPVAGARVELLHWDDSQARPRSVATGATGDDGVALLRLPDGFVIPEEEDDEDAGHGRWLVRAVGRDGSSRGVLPIEERHYSPAALGRAPERMTWGVSDRPVYHAGDTVHYRLWQRDRHGTRLLPIGSAPPVTLRLRDAQRDKDILTWAAQPAADGGIAGELVLPVHLTDATYCIGALQRYDVRGACFYVGTYRAQDLWVNASVAGPQVLRDGEPFALDIEAGYYSGGPAAGLQVEQVQSGLWPLPLQEAYPEYRDYEFVDTETDDTTDGPLAGLDDLDLKLDAQGKAHLGLRADFDVDPDDRANLPAFASLSLSADVKPQEREATTSNDVELRYARFDRYVGLRVAPAWLDAATPVRLTGIVIDAQGKRTAETSMDVDVDYLPGFARDAKPERIAQCTLQAGRESTCDFARGRSGRYRMTARSGDAAPAQVTRYVWADDDAGTGSADEPELELLGPPDADGITRRVMLKQPYAHARVLFVMRAGDAILGHLAARADGPAQAFVLPLRREGRGEVAIEAIVCDEAPSRVEDGYRDAPDCDVAEMERAAIGVDRGQKEAAVNVRFDSDTAHPGDTVHVLVSNDSRQKRDVVLAVMDDALRAQASRWLPYADPLGGDWLESAWHGAGSLDTAGFEEWNRSPWSWTLPWPQAAKHDAAAAGLPVPPGPPVVFDEPSPMDTQAPVPAPPPKAVVAEASSSLDRIEVTGSRISRVDLESPQTGAPPKGLRFDREAGPASALRMPAIVRFRFADTALWRPDLQLAPGETRSIEFKLPDNLTRWRAVAWSSDAGDDFTMADAALDTGLPVEVRLQTPVRLYAGDHARIAANLRQVGDAEMQAQVRFDVAGAGAPLRQDATVALPAHGEGSVAMRLSPTEPGAWLVTAAAQTAAGRDAVAAPVEIASPTIEGRKLQAGWLDDTPLLLDLPSLPQGASSGRVELSLQRGASGLVDTWTQDLRDYPHRCWEQILSRAVAAALALERGDSRWPDARVVVQEALDNAAVFQDREGGFRYFVPQSQAYDDEQEPSVALTAYTVRALSLLQELGYPVDAGIVQSAGEYLESASGLGARNDREADASSRLVGDAHAIALAFATSEAKDVDVKTLDLLWQGWSKLPLPAQLAAARAFASHSHAAAKPAVRALLERASVHGLARTLSMAPGDDAWMGSDMQEQCSLIELLHEYPALADPAMRSSLVRGLSDLYAGGNEAVDTQTGAACLMAIRDLAKSSAEDAGGARFGIGGQSLTLHLAARQRQDRGTIQSPAGKQLRIEPDLRADEPASYVAELHYPEDARFARPSAMGLAIDRRYDVLRGRKWVPVAAATLREGDWIRITLVVDTGATRHFVALTDSVPGGLRPTDLSLSGVGGLDLHKVDDTGSGYFTARRLDARSPRFYAEYLPAGRHEVHYFAAVGNSGDYLAAPAVAELMYGEATRARTAAARLVVPDRGDGAGP
jgi:uncharacterized protein YfaS (alpha-2-macroglobulin family)